MSEIGKKRSDEHPQEASQDDTSYDAEMSSLDQDPNFRQQELSPQVGRDKEPSSDVNRICEEVGKILSEIKQQTEMEELYLSGIQESVGAQVAEAVDEFVKFAGRYFDYKRKTVFEIVSEINGALQRIAEHDKMRDTVKDAMEATWNALA
ncbi:uncharacterized protein LOC142584391 [Dermacentor variabilis]|uniref:uncharacterized protein LOC142584391 n=1 Tax=Dermacentor variabilis TaxID=34621 RepID=UPI003F5C6635